MDVLSPFRPHVADVGIFGAIQQSLKVLEQRVFVLVEEPRHIVHHVTCVMPAMIEKKKTMSVTKQRSIGGEWRLPDAEIRAVLELLVERAQLPAGEVLVLRQLLLHGLEQHLIGDASHVEARLVHNGQDSLVRLFDEIAYYLIVKVLDVLPGDPFAQVLVLLLFEHQFCK